MALPSLPTLLDYPGVSWIQTKSPSLIYGSPNLPHNMKESAIFRYILSNFWCLGENFLDISRIFVVELAELYFEQLSF